MRARLPRQLRRRLGAVLIALAAGACAGSLQPVEIPAEGVRPRHSWLPEREPPRAAVLAIHGFNDYGRAIDLFATRAAAEGIATHAFDQRGFGANPDAGAWPGADVLIRDVRREIGRIRALHPEVPVYLLGISMGGPIASLAVSGEGAPAVDGLILSAPAFWGGDQLNPLYRATLWVAASLAPGKTLTGARLEVMPSDNIEVLRGLGRDPLVIKATRLESIQGLVRLMDRGVEVVPEIPGPVLVLAGERDEIVSRRSHLAMVERLEASPCTEATYPDGYHLLLRDLQREVVHDDIIAWIEGGPLPSGLSRPCGHLEMAAETHEAIRAE